MTDFKKVYQTQAEQYEYLVAHEDYQGNILRALQEIRPLTPTTSVIELGAGTGRLARLLAPHVAHITVCDISPHMLGVAQQKLDESGWHNWHIGACDNRAVALKSATADLVIAGWSVGHSVGWYPDSWRQEIGQALSEMRRLLRPNGTIILLETQGTNHETPHPPTPQLAEFFDWLVQTQGFQFTWIRTDYRYPSLAEAVASVRFFFGEEMAAAVQRQNSPIVPECTGIWCWHDAPSNT